MPQIVIENPILNSPYREPTRHRRFDANNEITNIIDDGRRESNYFLHGAIWAGRTSRR